jgi:lantibiotic biosynthesis protein
VTDARTNPSLKTGFTGVAWAAAHLAARAGASAEGVTAPADQALIDGLERGAWRSGFELVSGVCGVGVYALERLPAPAGRRLLELVVEELRRLSEPADPGVTWLARPEHLHPDTRARAPRGYHDLGLAHGVPGPVGVLAGGLAAGIPGCAELLDGAVAWLEAQALPEDDVSLLPYGIGKGANPASARLAWCYGDPGAAAALLLAARAGHAPAEALARRAIEKIAVRRDATAGVHGASLCHGTAGLAHMCGRLDPVLAHIARRWIAATLALRQPGAGPCGYSVLEPGDAGTVAGDVQGIGLLGGIAGVALALVAAASDTEPAWDRALLVSQP